MDYIVKAGHQVRFTFSDASQYSVAADTGNIITMYTGATGGLSQVRMPVAGAAPVASVPDLSGGIGGVGGPATGLLLGLGTAAAWRRRRARGA